ncbi:phosphatase PAP2 family protein [Luteipulveratus sp. YIM 133132]|uniref:phosphatase PAP2 family protein n=1 Tax=Luteipulveratus flavus TaxID=3031728 RepID=UPI0023AF7937|nr:phosphatase PAP2 family protein [Luteipulveratus sp. YIM 133132]MDE9364294.1 phosphatase PAP2 family protein [Luteipulveratus sp. YIM 133132]
MRTLRSGRLPAAVLLLVAFVLLYAVLVRTRAGQRADEDIYTSAALGRDHLLGLAGRLHDLVRVLAAAAVAAGLIVAVRGQRAAGVRAVAVVGLSGVSAEALKHLVLGRPDLAPTSLPVGASYPSARVAVGAAAVLALLSLAPAARRGLSAALAVVVVVLVAYAPVVSFAHRPSDVVGAVLLAGFWAVVVGAATPTAGNALLPSGVLVSVLLPGVVAWAGPPAELAYAAGLLAVLSATVAVVAATVSPRDPTPR